MLMEEQMQDDRGHNVSLRDMIAIIVTMRRG